MTGHKATIRRDNLDTIRHDYEKAARQKPSPDDWHLLVGMAVGIERDLRADTGLKDEAAQALQVLALGVNNLMRPYLGLQNDMKALGAEAPEPGRLATTFNSRFAQMGTAAMILADVALDIGPAFAEKDRMKLRALGAALNSTAQREVTGVGRAEKYKELLRFGQRL